jgi:Zn-finger nucleic acid-binding protein
VRLVACRNCHAQFDVSLVEDKEFRCRCGELVENRPPAGVDARVQRCGACGALASAAAKSCEYCGSSIIRDTRKLSLICPECCARNADDSRFCTACGVAFRPEPLPQEGSELPCPCCGCLMPPRQVGGVGVNECPECNGLWAPRGRFEQLVERALAAKRSGKASDGVFAPRVKGGNPASQSVQYRRCPECERFMQRRNFRKVSGVIIDRCHEHGTWLDADELERIAGFLLSGGRPEAAAMLHRVERDAEEAYQRARASQVLAGQAIWTDRDLGSRRGGSILKLLAELLR